MQLETCSLQFSAASDYKRRRLRAFGCCEESSILISFTSIQVQVWQLVGLVSSPNIAMEAADALSTLRLG